MAVDRTEHTFHRRALAASGSKDKTDAVTMIPNRNPGPSPMSPPPSAPQFEVVRRGYDRDQVDAALRDLNARLVAAAKARQAAEQQAQTTVEELRAARKRADTAEPTMSQESFGFRTEKILRMAEHEAADVRTRATREATAMVEQARAEAEHHRHEVEQALIARSAELDQEAAKRNVAVQEREQQAQVMLADAREESARIADEAQRNAEKLLADTQARSEELRQRTDIDCRRRRDTSEQELRRLNALRDGVRSEITRLHTLLGAEVENAPSDTQAKNKPEHGTHPPERVEVTSARTPATLEGVRFR